MAKTHILDKIYPFLSNESKDLLLEIILVTDKVHGEGAPTKTGMIKLNGTVQSITRIIKARAFKAPTDELFIIENQDGSLDSDK